MGFLSTIQGLSTTQACGIGLFTSLLLFVVLVMLTMRSSSTTPKLARMHAGMEPIARYCLQFLARFLSRRGEYRRARLRMIPSEFPWVLSAHFVIVLLFGFIPIQCAHGMAMQDRWLVSVMYCVYVVVGAVLTCHGLRCLYFACLAIRTNHVRGLGGVVGAFGPMAASVVVSFLLFLFMNSLVWEVASHQSILAIPRCCLNAANSVLLMLTGNLQGATAVIAGYACAALLPIWLFAAAIVTSITTTLAFNAAALVVAAASKVAHDDKLRQCMAVIAMLLGGLSFLLIGT